ncbi:MAG: molybdenum cofactor guanylyltransferase [Oscillospiraceae bacterium]|jgi:molybdopterin-guanine dinucleotide biosynthesis protein A|nr:molybdenum cofactor guanylyltransferase [Oscillospiraceae bacterium]
MISGQLIDAQKCAAVILAGGKSRRMGRDKLLLEIDGLTLIQSAAARFEMEFEELYLSVADAEKYPEIAARRVIDIHSGAGPLSGLHAALATIPCDGVFLVAADLPYSSPPAARRIVELCGEKEACVIKLPDGRLEPLFGYYKKSLLHICEDAISSGDYRMSELLCRADARFIGSEMLGGLWCEELLYNVNYPKDYYNIMEVKRQ